MKLIRKLIDIKNVEFAPESKIENGTLFINKKELEELLADPKFSSVEVDIAVPGTETRLMNIADVVQPTARADKGKTFPGIAGSVDLAGDGVSYNLRNVYVSEIMEVPVTIGCFLDMTGPATVWSDLHQAFHVTVDAMPSEGAAKEDYQRALHTASKKAAVYIGELALGLEADEEEVYTLDVPGLEGLPKVAYLADVFCQSYMSDCTIYGESMEQSMPVVVHPNEVLDGAVTDRNYGTLLNSDPTCVWQNHPIIKDLYKQHGKTLNFVGVVLSNTPHTLDWKDRNGKMSASIIHNMLHADCCIITKEGGGNPQIDVAIALNELELKFGVKCVLVLAEWLSMNNASREQLLFSSEAADAIVSTGCVLKVEVPAFPKVIGHTPIAPANGFTVGPITLDKGFSHRCRAVRGALSQLGNSYVSSIKF